MQDGTPLEFAAQPTPTRRGPRHGAGLRGVLVVVAVAAIGLAAFAAWDPIYQSFVPKRFGVVEPGRIYRSGQISASLIRATLERNGIRTIVALQHYDKTDPSHRAEHEAAEALGIREVHLHLRGDGSGDIRNYASALAEMARADREGTPLLVHCSAGSERTGAAVAFYRILVQQRPPADAYAELDRGGWDPDRNPGLPTYINDHMAELAGLLVAQRVIERVPEPLPVFGP